MSQKTSDNPIENENTEKESSNPTEINEHSNVNKERASENVSPEEAGAGVVVEANETTENDQSNSQINNNELDRDKTRKSARPKTMTEKGKESKLDQLEKQFWRLIKSASKTHEQIEQSIKSCTNAELNTHQNTISTHLNSLDEIYDQVILLHGKPVDNMLQTLDRVHADQRTLSEAIQTLRQNPEGSGTHPNLSNSPGIPGNNKSAEPTNPNSPASQLPSNGIQKALSVHSHITSVSNASSTKSVLSLRAKEAKVNAALLAAELEAHQAANELEEEIKRLEMEKENAIRVKQNHLKELKLRKALELEQKKAEAYEQAIADDKSNKSILLVKRTTIPNTNKFNTEHEASNLAETATFTKTLGEMISHSKLPAATPPTFSGDPLEYHDWNAAFTTLIDQRCSNNTEKMYYLKRYVSGSAKEAISGFFLLQNSQAYDKARKTLAERFGNHFAVADAFRKKLENWQRIQSRDSTGLRSFSDFLQQCETAMEIIPGLNVLNDSWENRKLMVKLPEWLSNRWIRQVAEYKEKHNSYPKFRNFTSFIRREAEIMCEPLLLSGNFPKSEQSRKTNRGTVLNTSTENPLKPLSSCLVCNKPTHTTSQCYTLAKRSKEDKQEFVKQNGLCYGCLKPGHVTKNCKNRSTCARCKKRHPTSLHNDEKSNESNSQNTTNTQISNNNHRTESLQTQEIQQDSICMKAVKHGQDSSFTSSMILPVWLSVNDNPTEEVMVYALCDTQSDTTFILDDTLQRLNISGENTSLTLTTMTQTTKIHVQKVNNLEVRGLNSSTRVKLPPVFSRQYIPVAKEHIPTPDKAQRWPHLTDIAQELHELQDCEIGLLIGYDCPQALAPKKSVLGKAGEPFAMLTDLGWSVIGKCDLREEGDAIGITHRIITKHNQELSDVKPVNFECKTYLKETKTADIIKILEADFKDSPSTDETSMSQDDLQFLHIIKDGIKQGQDGHYYMPLPFRTLPKLPSNRSMAERRLLLLKKRLERDEKYRNDYITFMEKIIENGDAELVPESDTASEGQWFIPHFGVYHPRKPDKVRVVFDCSAKFQGQSLNQCLLQGPDLMNKLVGVLLRFRLENIAIMCDVERMFHMFKVNSEDRKFLRFLWFQDNDLKKEVRVYQMTVHLFGAVSSPACATYGLRQIAQDHSDKGDWYSAKAAQFILKDFYVDDGLCSVPTVEDACKLVTKTRELCSKGNLHLHKFVSNSEKVMRTIPSSEHASRLERLDLSDNLYSPVERALGLEWSVKKDIFRFCCQPKEKPPTRRNVLSTVATVFDPLGLVAPFVLIGKQILQTCCQDGAAWDDTISEELVTKWNRWKEDLSTLEKIEIQRCVKPKDFKVIKKELHHFCDASTTGYGQCSYLRVVNDVGEVHCSLIFGKARVTPLKATTIPRLELQAAVVSIRVSQLVKKELELDISDTEEYFWTDSRIVLGYIKNDSKRFQTYVANRVQTIRTHSNPNQWHYILSEQNPADHASRGTSVKELLISNWFTGPGFLWQRDLQISGDNECYQPDPHDPEVKSFTLVTRQEHNELIEKLSKFSTLTSAVNAFGTLLKAILKRKKKLLSQVEVNQSILTLFIKACQQEHFADEMQTIRLGNNLTLNCKIRQLDPYIGKDGILRVGGRLHHSSLNEMEKHPIILPCNSHLSKLIIDKYHREVGHGGKGMTMSKIRSEGYWIVNLGSAVSTHIHRCVTCQRIRGPKLTQKMANLPQERVEPSPPFTFTGCDIFGPFLIKYKRSQLKRYGVMFTCMSSRSVHLEMVDSLTTTAFINAFRCLVSLRGPVSKLFCDRGTNFVGADAELKRALNDMEYPLQKLMAEHQCEFVFKSPASSHMGGVWERQIRSARNVLKGLLANMRARPLLDDSGLRTLLYEVTAIVNSRPLTVESLQDPFSPLAITPNQLLTQKTSVVLPLPGEFSDADIYSQKQWRCVQHLANCFWDRWKREYLQTLQTRQKWLKEENSVQVGDIVLLQDDNSLRNIWKLGKITNTFPGKDGLVRQVSVKLGDRSSSRTIETTEVNRPIHKLKVLVKAKD